MSEKIPVTQFGTEYIKVIEVAESYYQLFDDHLFYCHDYLGTTINEDTGVRYEMIFHNTAISKKDACDDLLIQHSTNGRYQVTIMTSLFSIEVKTLKEAKEHFNRIKDWMLSK